MKKMPSDMVAHTYNPNIWEAEAGRWRIPSQLWLHSKTLSLNTDKKKKRLGLLSWGCCSVVMGSFPSTQKRKCQPSLMLVSMIERVEKENK
jgi:hypothetical protein